jgi:hypothetical protein
MARTLPKMNQPCLVSTHARTEGEEKGIEQLSNGIAISGAAFR